MMRYDAMTEEFQEAVILDKPALFTPVRINRDTVPHGYYLYEVRHDDDCRGDAVQIARNICVNHWGSMITRDEIEMPSGFMDITPDSLNYSAGDCRSMKEFMSKYPKTEAIKNLIKIVDAPDASLGDGDKPGDVLLKFYYALGWNGEGALDPCKIRTTEAVFNRLYNVIYEKFPDPVGVGIFLVNTGSGTDSYVPPGKVSLLEG